MSMARVADLKPFATVPRLGTHLPALDGLRGLAILLVMMFHLGRSLPLRSWVGDWLAKLPATGWCGVDLFFVLSGFLITGILYDAKGGRAYFRNFYARRTLRIFPLYYGVLFVIFVLLPPLVPALTADLEPVAVHQLWLWFYGPNVRMFLVGDWVFGNGWCHLGHFWSLAVEEHFYLVWPLVVYLLPRRGLLAFCGGCMGVAFALRLVLVLTGQPTLGAYTLTPCRMDSLAMGAFFSLAARSPGGLARLGRWAPLQALVSGSLLAGLFVWRHGLFEEDPLVQTAGYSLLAVFFAGLLVLTLTAPHSSPLGLFANHPVMRFFGKYSYGLYVFHVLLHPFCGYLLPVKGLEALLHSHLLALALHGGGTLGITLLATLLSWHLYEKQFLKLKRFFEYSDGTRPSAAAPAKAVRPEEAVGTDAATGALVPGSALAGS